MGTTTNPGISTPNDKLLEELRRKTRVHHESLEQAMAEQHYFADLPAYRRLLERWYGWYEPWEMMAASQAPPKIARFLGGRWKVPMLRQDLHDLGTDSLERLPRAKVVEPAEQAEWIGTMYVLEGSTLGGQFIARSIEEQFDFKEGRGYSFFRSYGGQVGSMWREFREFAQRNVAEDETERAVAAADQTFLNIHTWLCPTSK